MSWRKSAGNKYFPTPNKVKASNHNRTKDNNNKRRRRKRQNQHSRSLPTNRKKKRHNIKLPEWYPSNKHDLSSFTAAADLVAQMRYEQLIESRAQRLMREYWADGFKRKQHSIKQTSMMNHYGADHPKNRRDDNVNIYDYPKKSGFLEPIDPVHLISDEHIDELAEKDAGVGSKDRFERKVRVDHLKHSYVESRMLTRKLKEIQIEWDDKMKRQREQKAKSKLNTIEKKRRGINKTNLQPGQFEPYEETKELSKVNQWLERHNESALKNRMEQKRLEAIKKRERRKARYEHHHEKQMHKHRNKMKNKIKHGAWVSNPPEYLFNSDTFYTNNTATNDGKNDFGNDIFVDDVDLSGMKVYNNKNVRLIGETSIKRKVKQDNAKLPVLPPISMITPCAVISGGRKVHKPYKWR